MSFPPIIVLDGPRGVGKTTLVKNLIEPLKARGLNVAHVPERLDMWTDWHGENVLERAIEVGDNRFFFQCLVLHSYKISLDAAMKTNPDAIIMERWPGSATHVFSEIALRNKKMSVGEFELIKELTKTFQKITAVIGLWCSDYPTIRDRVVAREQETATEWWTRQVFDMYKEYFATLEGCADNFVLLDTAGTSEEVADNALEIIKRFL